MLFFLGNSVLPETPAVIGETQNINNVQDIAATANTSTITTVTLNIPILGISRSQTTDTTIPHVSSSASLSSATTTTVYSTINTSKCSTKTDDTSVKIEQNLIGIQETMGDIKPNTESIQSGKQDCFVPNNHEAASEVFVSCNSSSSSINETNLKRKSDTTHESESPSKQSKQNILNHSLPLLNLSNNHPLKKHSKLNRNGENVKNSSPKVVILENDIIVPSGAVSSCVKIDVPAPKITILDKGTSPNKHTTRPSTPISLSKSILSTKASIIPQKLPSTTYAAQKPPCYMPKTTYSPVLNVPKPVTSNTR